MVRRFRSIIFIGLIALALFVPQVVFAGVEDSDNGCPPRSAQGTANASTTGLDTTFPINPPANANAWAATNPGNK